MAKFDSILGTIGNTPTVRINNLTPRTDVNLFVKIEAFNPLDRERRRRTVRWLGGRIARMHHTSPNATVCHALVF